MTICCVLLVRGFTVNTASRTHVFKPVSVQAMWWVINNLWSLSGCLLHYNVMTYHNINLLTDMHTAAVRQPVEAVPIHSATCWQESSRNWLKSFESVLLVKWKSENVTLLNWGSSSWEPGEHCVGLLDSNLRPSRHKSIYLTARLQLLHS